MKKFVSAFASIALVAGISTLAALPAGAIGGVKVVVTSPSSAVEGPDTGCKFQTSTAYYCVPAGSSSVTFQLANSGGVQLPAPYSATNSNTGPGQFTNAGDSVTLTPSNPAAGQQMIFSVGVNPVLTVYFTSVDPEIVFNGNPYNANARGQVQITGTVVNQFNNPLSGVTVSGQIINPSTNLNRNINIPNATTNNSGQFTLSYTDQVSSANTYIDIVKVTASAPGGGSSSANATVYWRNAPNNLSNMTFNSTPTGSYNTAIQVANTGGLVLGQNTVLVSVDTPTPNYNVKFSTTGGGLLVTPNGNENNGDNNMTVQAVNGKATVWFFSTQIGNQTITAAGSNQLSGQVNFVPSATGARNVSLALSSGAVQAGATTTATATVTDGFNNPVGAGVSVTFQITTGTANFTNGTKTFVAATDANGKAIAYLTEPPTTGGQVTVTATGAGAQFGQAAGQPLRFYAGSVPVATAIVGVTPSVLPPALTAPKSVKVGKNVKMTVINYPGNQVVNFKIKLGKKVLAKKAVASDSAGTASATLKVNSKGTASIIVTGPGAKPKLTQALTIK